MSRKDYKAIARILRKHYACTVGDINARVLTIAEDLAGMLEQDNARFDRGRFIAAIIEMPPLPKDKCSFTLPTMDFNERGI